MPISTDDYRAQADSDKKGLVFNLMLRPIDVRGVDDPNWLRWASGQTFHLPEEVEIDLRPFMTDGVLSIPSGAELDDYSDSIRQFAAYTFEKPASSRLPISYQRIPPRIRSIVGRAIGLVERGRSESWAAFPRWPIDLSADFAEDLASKRSKGWSDGSGTPVMLSHDLDSPEGVANLRRFLEVEESHGARSTNFLVPRGWDIDHAALERAISRGHEIGIHGYDHSNRTPYCDADERRIRLEAARGIIERYEAQGYRSPSLVRTPELLEDLADYYLYDSSIPTSGGRFPVPNNGNATARPYRIGGLVEVPLTLPRDGSLRFLGHSARSCLEIWKKTATTIKRSGGIVSILTHCESRFSGNNSMFRAYTQFLEFLANDGEFRFMTGVEVAKSERT